MKILHLLAMDSFSGAENVAITIMESCTSADMVYASPDGSIRNVVERRGLKFYALKSVDVNSIRKAIKQIKPDIIHAHDPRMSFLSFLSAPLNVKIVSHLHNNPTWIQSLNINTLSYLVASIRFSKIITVSECISKEFFMSQFMRKKWVCVSNCINAEYVKKQGGYKPEVKGDIVFVGRLTEQKDPVMFLEISKRLYDNGIRHKAILIGDGELRTICEEWISENKANEYITIMGYQSNPYPIMANAAVLVIPSKWEGFGLVAVEAICLGIPVVCSGAGGLSGIVDESCGSICKTLDDYVYSISELLLDDTKRAEKHECSLLKAVNFTNTKVYGNRITDIYNSVIRKG